VRQLVCDCLYCLFEVLSEKPGKGIGLSHSYTFVFVLLPLNDINTHNDLNKIIPN
jgi:hypothetical protein